MDEGFRDRLLLEMHGELKAQGVSVSEIKEDLKLHMKRTAQNETYIKNVEERQSNDMAYVKRHIWFVRGAFWVLLVLIPAAAGLAFKLGAFN